ncbi:hypothetical protein ACO0OE_002802 [Hanseniaspora uvarum]|nr:Csc1 protein [Hanseniaspora uvarum]
MSEKKLNNMDGFSTYKSGLNFSPQHPTDPRRPSAIVVTTQLYIAISLGLSALIAFSIMLRKMPWFYSSRIPFIQSQLDKQTTTHTQNSIPVWDSTSKNIFNWIPNLFKVDDLDILKFAGIDAFVYLSFFKMCIKLLLVSSILGVFIISPIRYKHTGNYDDGDDENSLINGIIDNVIQIAKRSSIQDDVESFKIIYVWMYLIFTYIFTFITLFLLMKHTRLIVNIRQKILGKQNKIVDKTIRVTGIPLNLRNEKDLKKLIENNLGLGQVEKIVICKDWGKLDKLFEKRSKHLKDPVKLSLIDNQIRNLRENDEFATISSAFITFDTVANAQMAAQTLLDPRVHFLQTSLAPAPHDIKWRNMFLTSKERFFKNVFVTSFNLIISLFLIVPVSYLATLLNLKTILKFWPSLGNYLVKNKWAENLITGLLPTYLFTFMNFIMPFAYETMTSYQGFISYSEEEISLVSKNFFYIFVNLFLVFTLAGTYSNFWGYFTDTTKIAYQLAQSIKEFSLFYVDLIILQGIGMFPFKLLLIGNMVELPFIKNNKKHNFETPLFNFGLQLPQSILILIITLIYSVLSTKILVFGLIYFVIGYHIYKFQFIYSMNHLPHSTGQVWPLIYRRVIMGLLIFQLTMAGTLAGYHNGWILSMLLIPSPLITLSYLWDFEKNYIPLIKFIALSSIRDFERIEFTRESSRLEGGEYTISSESSSSSLINNTESSLDDDFEFTDLLTTDFLPGNRRFRSQSISYLSFMKFTDAVTDNDVDDINNFNNYKYSAESQDYSYPLLSVPLPDLVDGDINSPEFQRYTDEQV